MVNVADWMDNTPARAGALLRTRSITIRRNNGGFVTSQTVMARAEDQTKRRGFDGGADVVETVFDVAVIDRATGSIATGIVAQPGLTIVDTTSGRSFRVTAVAFTDNGWTALLTTEAKG